MQAKFYKENCFVNMPKHMVEQSSLQILHHYYTKGKFFPKQNVMVRVGLITTIQLTIQVKIIRQIDLLLNPKPCSDCVRLPTKK